MFRNRSLIKETLIDLRMENKWKAINRKKGFTFFKRLLDAGFNVNSWNKYGKTMLSYVAAWENLEITEFIVQKGGDGNVMNSDGIKPIHIAALYGRKDIVKFYLDRGVSADSCDNDKCTPLHYVARNLFFLGRMENYFEIIHLLVNSKCNLDAVDRFGRTPLRVAARSLVEDYEELYKLITFIDCRTENKILYYCSDDTSVKSIEEYLCSRAEMRSVSAGSPVYENARAVYETARAVGEDTVELFIKLGANIHCSDADQRNLLHFSSLNGWLDIVKYLVEKGFDINAEDNEGSTPLTMAVCGSYIGIIEYFIECGANYNDLRFADGMTLLHRASQRKWLTIVDLLIEKKYDLNVQDESNDTPLHYAIRYRNNDILEHLLEAGADWNLENNKELTPFNEFINNYFSIPHLILFIENGAYFNHNNYCKLFSNLKQSILLDVKHCTQAVINQINFVDLPELYNIPAIAGMLPPMEKLKITSNKNVVQHIAECVNNEIRTKGFYDVLNSRPNVLSSLCIETLLDYYDD